MNAHEWLTQQFEANRPHLREVAFRMLGSLGEADDALQQTWLKLDRSDASGVENLTGWLTTIVARVCLDMLRSRASRREEAFDPRSHDRPAAGNPEEELVVANAVGLALLVVLDTLAPAERLAFVLHDIFAMPFEEIAPIVDRSPEAARQLASRARRRVQGQPPRSNGDLGRQREVVDAFLAAARGGDLRALLAILDPNVVLRGDAAAMRGAPAEIRGAAPVAERAIRGGARAAQPALIGGELGVIVAPRGRLLMLLRFTIDEGRIVAIDAIGDPERVRQLGLGVV
ncbi:MAG TPA: sigma-70 family RNA polymerase sigma factor [Thermoanaerobaculia bacterium]|nr:sigma-70 family RNA polymerase sigma factor [Thermoanaerobaculia bacterium]